MGTRFSRLLFSGRLDAPPLIPDFNRFNTNLFVLNTGKGVDNFCKKYYSINEPDKNKELSCWSLFFKKILLKIYESRIGSESSILGAFLFALEAAC